MCDYCCSQKVHEGKNPFKCKKCNYRSSQKGELNQHVSTIHKGRKSFKHKMCKYCFPLKVHEGKKPSICENWDLKGELNQHVSTIQEVMKTFKCKL